MAGRDDLVEAWSRIRTLVLDNDVRVEVSETLGLSFIKIRVLRRLLAGPLTMGELAAELVTDKPYVTQIVGDLETAGLVTRSIRPDDRRRRFVSLTDSGRAAGRRAEQILNRPPASLAALPPDDLAALRRILASLPRG